MTTLKQRLIDAGIDPKQFGDLRKKEVRNAVEQYLSNLDTASVSEATTEQTSCSVEPTWTDEDEAERKRICVGLAVSRGYTESEAINLYNWAINQSEYTKVFDKFISRLEGGSVGEYGITRDNSINKQPSPTKLNRSVQLTPSEEAMTTSNTDYDQRL